MEKLWSFWGNPPFADTNDTMIKTRLYKRTNEAKRGGAAVLLAARGEEDGSTKIRVRYMSMSGDMTMALDTGAKGNKESNVDAVVSYRHRGCKRIFEESWNGRKWSRPK
jgi:hypothetical protein